MKSYDEIVKFLEDPIPRDEVSTRSGGGKSLSYLETWRVIDLLNAAFGNLGWDCETVDNRQVNPGSPDKPTYVSKVRIKAIVQVAPGQFINITKEGTGYGIDKSGLNPHEMASKEAESDALKRAAMKFGKRLGLALYDKTQEFVTDGEKETNHNYGGAVRPLVQAGNREVLREGDRQSSPEAPPVQKTVSSSTSRETILKAIAANSQIAWSKKLRTQEELQKLVSDLGVSKKEDLSDEQARKLLTQLEELVK